MARFLPIVDDRYDKYVFFGVLAGGALLIVITKQWQGGEVGGIYSINWLPALVSALVVGLYVVYLLGASDRPSISNDRAGDNVYYLGLLFTLFSLVLALHQLGSNLGASGNNGVSNRGQGVLQLLPDFGLALSSTIAGIVGRVFLQQFRNDPVDVEAQARFLLGEAVRTLRQSLITAASTMNDTSKTLEVAITDISTRTSETIEQTAEKNVAQITRLTEKVEELVTRFEGQVEPVGAGLTRLGEEVVGAADHVRSQVRGLNFDGTSVQQSLESLAVELANIRTNMKQSADSFSAELSTLAQRFGAVLPESVVNEVRDVARNVRGRDVEMNSQFTAVVGNLDQMDDSNKALTERLEATTNRLENSAAELDQAFEQANKNLSGTARNLGQVDRTHNAISLQMEGFRSELSEGRRTLRTELDALEKVVRETKERESTKSRWKKFFGG